MTTVPITCYANDQNGNLIAGAVLTAKLNQTEIYNGFVVPELVRAVADANGVAVLNLWPNALGVNGSMYRITAVNPDTGQRFLDVTVSVPNSACNLHQIITVEPYPAIDASQQALAAAQGALALVNVQVDIAANQATSAAASAATALDSANSFATSLAVVATNVVATQTMFANYIATHP